MNKFTLSSSPHYCSSSLLLCLLFPHHLFIWCWCFGLPLFLSPLLHPHIHLTLWVSVDVQLTCTSVSMCLGDYLLSDFESDLHPYFCLICSVFVLFFVFFWHLRFSASLSPSDFFSTEIWHGTMAKFINLALLTLSFFLRMFGYWIMHAHIGLLIFAVYRGKVRVLSPD